MTAGLKTTCGSRMLANFTAPYDAFVVEGLKKAGTVLVGKTNMDEFAMGSSNETSFFGTGEEPVEHRLRARRQFGRLGRRGGGAPRARRHRHRHRRLDPPARVAVGHLRHEADLRRVLALRPRRVRVEPRHARHVRAHGGGLRPAAQRDGRPRSARLDVARCARARTTRAISRKPLAGLRIGLPAEYFGEGIDADVAAAIDAALARIPQAGRDDRRRRTAERQAVGARLLRHRAGRSVVEPVALRRRALRPSRREVHRSSSTCTRSRARKALAPK